MVRSPAAKFSPPYDPGPAFRVEGYAVTMEVIPQAATPINNTILLIVSKDRSCMDLPGNNGNRKYF